MSSRARIYRSFWLLAIAFCTNHAAAARAIDPDWPCQQVKVEQLSVAAFWAQAGATLDVNWQQDSAVATLVGELTQRRLPIERAIERIDAFTVAVGPQKTSKLLALFSGIFEVLNRERSTVLSGLDRFGQSQKRLATNLRNEAASLRDMLSASPHDDKRVAELSERMMWDQQIFESRRQSAQFACNVPGKIEQRIYQLAKAIERQMP